MRLNTTSMTATNFTAQKTAISTVDTLPGHEMHQAVIVLPQRTDEKIWVGTLSWSASKPVEVRLLQNYDANVKPDAVLMVSQLQHHLLKENLQSHCYYKLMGQEQYQVIMLVL